MGNWNIDTHGGAAPPIAGNDEFSSKQASAFAHSQDAQRGGAGDLVRPNAAAVIANLQGDGAALLGQIDTRTSGARVPRDVRQSLLQDAKERSGPFRINRRIRPGQTDPALDSGALLKLFRGPFHGGPRAEMIQDSRPEVGRDSAHRLNRFVDPAHDAVDALRPLRPARSALQRGQVDLDGGQSLSQFVVDLPRQSGSLLLPHALQMS